MSLVGASGPRNADRVRAGVRCAGARGEGTEAGRNAGAFAAGRRLDRDCRQRRRAAEESAPRIVGKGGGRLVVPVIRIYSALGIAVARSGNAITASAPGKQIVLHIGSAHAMIDGRGRNDGGARDDDRGGRRSCRCGSSPNHSARKRRSTRTRIASRSSPRSSAAIRRSSSVPRAAPRRSSAPSAPSISTPRRNRSPSSAGRTCARSRSPRMRRSNCRTSWRAPVRRGW